MRVGRISKVSSDIQTVVCSEAKGPGCPTWDRAAVQKNWEAKDSKLKTKQNKSLKRKDVKH